MSDLFSLDGRRAIVTGGVKGLGFAMAQALAHAGAEVVALDVDDDGFAGARTAAAEAGADISYRHCDVSKPDDVREAASAYDDGTPLVLVNNAGVGNRLPVTEVPLEEWPRILDTNLYGVFLCSRYFGEIMLGHHDGSIINIASVYGFLGPDGRLYTEGTNPPPYESPIYSASKGGVLGMTRALACAWARQGVRVNAISPGMFLTYQSRAITGEVEARLSDRTPLGRIGVPEDLGGAVVFLASGASSFVTGHNLVVDGGWSAW